MIKRKDDFLEKYAQKYDTTDINYLMVSGKGKVNEHLFIVKTADGKIFLECYNNGDAYFKLEQANDKEGREKIAYYLNGYGRKTRQNLGGTWDKENGEKAIKEYFDRHAKLKSLNNFENMPADVQQKINEKVRKLSAQKTSGYITEKELQYSYLIFLQSILDKEQVFNVYCNTKFK